jgi:DNA-binding CsgD family transcriptional regulator
VPSYVASGSLGALSVLGIGAGAEQVYRVVLRNPGCSLDFLANRVGRPPSEVTGDVDVLADAGLVFSNGAGVRPERPEEALGRLLARESRALVAAEAALAHARLQVPAFEVEHRSGLEMDPSSDGVHVVAPLEIPPLMTSLAATTVGEMLFLRPDQWRVPAGRPVDDAVAEAVRSGRASRVLYPVEVLDHPSPLVAQRLAAGERVRLLRDVPCRMAVFGDQAVMLPQVWGGPTGTVVVLREPGVVAACVAWFEELWRHGVGLPGEVTDDGPGALLDLLVRGAKDEQVARELGISLRTVRRRIASMLAELGVETRFQAGVEAARRGWL